MKKILDPGAPWLVMLCLIAALVALSGCVTTDPKVEAPLTVQDVRASQALAVQKIGESATDGETKRLAIFAVMAMGTGNQPAPPPVVQGPRSVGEAIFGFLDRTFERALNIAPAYLAYKGQVRSAQTTEKVAEINRDVSLNQSNNFLALGTAGINGTQNVGVAGVNALASVASQPSTVITGNTGPVNAGNGTLTFAPITGSQNPTNPAKICTTNAAGIQTCI